MLSIRRHPAEKPLSLFAGCATLPQPLTCGIYPPLTQRLRAYLSQNTGATPRLIIDLQAVAQQYTNFTHALPRAHVYYAVKANPEMAVLKTLVNAGSNFDTASPQEVADVLAAGADPSRISYGNTIKKEADIAKAYAMGVRLFAFDSAQELEKLARSAPGAQVFCRILCDCEGAEWPLSRKFGCDETMATALLVQAKECGLVPRGVSFHVGSQQNNVAAWDNALAAAARVFGAVQTQGITLNLLNLGGGFPARYTRSIPSLTQYGQAIDSALQRHFGTQELTVIIEPGRGMVGDAGILESEVVLVSQKGATDPLRWVYLDIGKFGGLAETADESIRYPIVTPYADDAPQTLCVVAGPTCDSFDVLYEKTPYALPTALKTGDKVQLLGAGAYTVTYAAVNFNGFAPPSVVCI